VHRNSSPRPGRRRHPRNVTEGRIRPSRIRGRPRDRTIPEWCRRRRPNGSGTKNPRVHRAAKPRGCTGNLTRAIRSPALTKCGASGGSRTLGPGGTLLRGLVRPNVVVGRRAGGRAGLAGGHRGKAAARGHGRSSCRSIENDSAEKIRLGRAMLRCFFLVPTSRDGRGVADWARRRVAAGGGSRRCGAPVVSTGRTVERRWIATRTPMQ